MSATNTGGSDAGTAVRFVTDDAHPEITHVEVMGRLEETTFPDCCVRCGEAAYRSLPIYKLFYRSHHDSPSQYLLRSVSPPFCSTCLDSHHQALPPLPASVKRRLMLSWLMKILPYLFPLGVCFWFVNTLFPKFWRTFTSGGLQKEHLIETLIWLGVVGFFAMLALMFVGMIRQAGNQLILSGTNVNSYVQCEQGPFGVWFIAPVEPTATMHALDFTDDQQELFDAERHRYTFTNPVVARQFAAINADKKWDPSTPRARRAAVGRWIVIGAVVLFALYQILFHPK